MRLALLSLPILALAACGSGPEQTGDANASADGLDTPSAKQRVASCQDDLKRYTDGGILALTADGKPTTTRRQWDGLSPVARTEIAEITACLQSGGAPGAQEVVIAETGSGAELARINTPNTLHMP